MPKIKIILKKKLKDKHGVYLGDADKEKKEIRINMTARAHKDKAELASTVKHELMHIQKPNATEKQIYKATAKTKIPEAEQNRLLAKIRMKKLNYKGGAIKRKFKMGPKKTEPGEFISQVNENKTPRLLNTNSPMTGKRLAILGMV